jgi:plastocyanin
MKKVLSLSSLTVTAIVLVACGGSSSSSTSTTVLCGPGAGFAGGGGQRLKLSAVPSGAPKYNTNSLTADKPGKVTIDFNNPSSNCHDVAVKDPPGKVYGVSERIKNGKTSVKLNLHPGEYFYYSTVPGEHTTSPSGETGMTGTLTVK